MKRSLINPERHVLPKTPTTNDVNMPLEDKEDPHFSSYTRGWGIKLCKLNENKLMIFIFLGLSILFSTFLEARTINFTGPDWEVWTGTGGPGPNNWSDSSASVRVDRNDLLYSVLPSTVKFETGKPLKPQITSPENNTINVPLMPTIEAGSLNVDHNKTEWEIKSEDDLLLEITSSLDLTQIIVPDLILDPGMKYYCRARFYDSQDNATEWSDPIAFYTLLSDPVDLNKNGIPDDQELPSGTNTDFDGNSISDLAQNDIKCLSTVIGGETIGLKMSTNCKSIKGIKSIDPNTITDTANKPSDFPIGLVSFKVEVSQGALAEVIIYLSEPAAEGAKWYMYDETNGWREYQHAIFNADRTMVTLQLKDGDASYGDTDGAVNGIIVDPSGLAEEGFVDCVDCPFPPCFITSSTHSVAYGIPFTIFVGIVLIGIAGVSRKRKIS